MEKRWRKDKGKRREGRGRRVEPTSTNSKHTDSSMRRLRFFLAYRRLTSLLLMDFLRLLRAPSERFNIIEHFSHDKVRTLASNCTFAFGGPLRYSTDGKIQVWHGLIIVT